MTVMSKAGSQEAAYRAAHDEMRIISNIFFMNIYTLKTLFSANYGSMSTESFGILTDTSAFLGFLEASTSTG